MSHHKKQKYPVLLRLTIREADSIANMFRLYDYKATGKIPDYLAVKLLHTLGFKFNEALLSKEVVLNEILLLVDQMIPEPEPVLVSSLSSFCQMNAVYMENPDHVVSDEAGGTDNGGQSEEGIHFNAPKHPYITPHCIAKFMEQLGRPPISMNEANLLLNSMLEYDDCSEIPCVSTDIITKELVYFAKKTNAFRDYRP